MLGVFFAVAVVYAKSAFCFTAAVGSFLFPYTSRLSHICAVLVNERQQKRLLIHVTYITVVRTKNFLSLYLKKWCAIYNQRVKSNAIKFYLSLESHVTFFVYRPKTTAGLLFLASRTT